MYQVDYKAFLNLKSFNLKILIMRLVQLIKILKFNHQELRNIVIHKIQLGLDYRDNESVSVIMENANEIWLEITEKI